MNINLKYLLTAFFSSFLWMIVVLVITNPITINRLIPLIMIFILIGSLVLYASEAKKHG
jgi:hypothetical protein